MKNRLWTICVSLLIPLVGILSCGDTHQEREPGMEHGDEHGIEQITIHGTMAAQLGLTFHVVRMDTLGDGIIAPAKLLLNQDLQAHVGSFLPGRVSRVFARLGDHVRKGEILFHIEGLDIGEIKAEYIKALSSLKLAERVLERQRTLVEQNVTSRKTLDEAQVAYDKALAEFNAVDRKIHSIGLDDADVAAFVDPTTEEGGSHTGGILPVRSPIDGVVAERNIVIGQLVDQATTAFTIINTSILWADAQLQETDIPHIDRNATVRLSVSAYQQEWFDGRIIHIGEMVDPSTRTVTLRAEIPNRKGKLKPEMFAEMGITKIGVPATLHVPAESVVDDEGRSYLFVAVSDSVFEKRSVRTGISRGEDVQILEGLTVGERIVVKGSFLLKSELKKESFMEEDH